ncbi:MAG: hypothetical protein ACTSQI_14350 [Candidatus Helarchaeota archaeon]
MEKSKKVVNQKKFDKMTLVSTGLIIIISIFSVIAVFFLNNVQAKGKYNRQLYEKHNDLLDLVEGDIDLIMETDTQLQQLAVSYQQEFLLLNMTVGQMQAYNLLYPGTYTQTEIDGVAIQAALKIRQVNALINQTYAFDWGTFYLGMSAENNYSYPDPISMQIIDYYLIQDKFKEYKPSLNPTLLFWVNRTYFSEYNGSDPELLQINLLNWQGMMYNDTSVIQTYASHANEFAGVIAMNYEEIPSNYLSSNSYFNLLSNGDHYNAVADVYNQASTIMGIALICLAISAVIIAFAVSIVGRKYVWMSVILGAAVMVIAMVMFGLSIQYSIQALQIEYWGVF